MYSLDINFLSDREVIAEGEVRQPIADTQYLIGGGVLAAVLLAIAGGAYFYVSYTAADLQTQLDTLTGQEAALDATLAQLAGSEKSIQEIDARTKTLVDLFVGDIPASAVLQEIRARMPEGVQIKSITQNGKTIKLDGLATSLEGINNTVLLLQSSPYVDSDKTKLNSAKKQAEKKDVQVTLYDYSIDATLTEKSSGELLPQLEKSGADGLVQRIKSLQEKGVITQ